jgi:F-type H+-transporting ATPase subunit gamma
MIDFEHSHFGFVSIFGFRYSDFPKGYIMATLKDVQMKIAAVKKTKQITKAMNMVAASKLRGAQEDMEGFRPYAGKFAEVLGSLAEKSGEEASPLLVPRDEVKKIHLVLFTSDRGLCGGFNTNLNAKAGAFAKEKKGKEVSFTAFGKKGRNWIRNSKMTLTDEYIGMVGGNFDFSVASNAGRQLVEAFLDGIYDEVWMIYPVFVNIARQIPTLKQLLPIPPIESQEEEEEADQDKPYLAEHICEPSQTNC